jgi:hypothetical protein
MFIYCGLAKPVFCREDFPFFEMGVSCHFQEASQCFVSMDHTKEKKSMSIRFPLIVSDGTTSFRKPMYYLFYVKCPNLLK